MEEKYDYLKAVYDAAEMYIEDNLGFGNGLERFAGDRAGLIKHMVNSDDFYDTVTGCGNNSFFCNAELARNALCHNMDYLDLFCHVGYDEAERASVDYALPPNGFDNDTVVNSLQNPEKADVNIRAFILESEGLLQVADAAVCAVEAKYGIDFDDEHTFDNGIPDFDDSRHNGTRYPQSHPYHDYLYDVMNHVIDYIEENIDLEEFVGDKEGLMELLHENMLNEESSYVVPAWEAEENICHNLDKVIEAYNEYGEPADMLLFVQDAEKADRAIRCSVLPEAIEKAVKQIEIEKNIDLAPSNKPGKNVKSCPTLD